MIKALRTGLSVAFAVAILVVASIDGRAQDMAPLGCDGTDELCLHVCYCPYGDDGGCEEPEYSDSCVSYYEAGALHTGP